MSAVRLACEVYDELVLVREIPLSELARVVEQERLQPKGVGVVLEAKPGARTVTSALHGLLRDDPRSREEFLTLVHGRS